jgi:hypothetical protein
MVKIVHWKKIKIILFCKGVNKFVHDYIILKAFKSFKNKL